MNNHRLATLLEFLGIGWFVAISVLAGILGGLWLDHRFETLPIFTLLCLLGGGVVAFYGMYRMVIRVVKNNEDQPNNGGK